MGSGKTLHDALRASRIITTPKRILLLPLYASSIDCHREQSMIDSIVSNANLNKKFDCILFLRKILYFKTFFSHFYPYFCDRLKLRLNIEHNYGNVRLRY